MPASVVSKPDLGTHGLTVNQYKLLGVAIRCRDIRFRRNGLLEIFLLPILTGTITVAAFSPLPLLTVTVLSLYGIHQLCYNLHGGFGVRPP